MSNQFYSKYLEKCEYVEQLMKNHGGSGKDAKKLRGALASELLREEIGAYLKENHLACKVTAVNVYIAGSKYEYDLLIVKENAVPFMELLYEPDDVLAIIESKAGGLFDVDKNTSSIAMAVNAAQEINRSIRFGYITMSENVPVGDYNYDGNPTTKHWELTTEYLSEKIIGEKACYAVTLHKGRDLCDEGMDEEFHRFVNYLAVGDC